MARKVTLYTDNEVQSALARDYLASNKVDFKEVNTAKDGNRMAIARHRLPFLEVKSSHGISTVSGFGEFQYASALNPNLSYDEFAKARKTTISGKQSIL
jgi:hypothetical protein